MKQSAQVMSSDNKASCGKLLPMYVDRIKVSTEECEKLTKEIGNRFDNLIELIRQVNVVVH